MSARACFCLFLLAIGSAPAEGLRLAATIVGEGTDAALLTTTGGSGWYRTGSRAAGCLLTRVEDRAVWLDCEDHTLRLGLSGSEDSRAEDPRDGDRPRSVSVDLEPGLLARFAAEPQSLALAVDFAPAVTDGGLLGWRVARLSPGSPPVVPGLAEGDVITSVAGVPASQPLEFAAAVRALPELPAFDCEVLRDGRRLVLYVSSPPGS